MTDSNTAVTFLPDGNVCTPKGFRASGIHCGLRHNKTKKDLALIVSDVPAAAAAVYTLNAVKGAPIAVTKANIADGRAQAMLCNSGNANTCAHRRHQGQHRRQTRAGNALQLRQRQHLRP